MRPKNGRNDSLDIFALRLSLQQMLSQARMLLYIAMSNYSHSHIPIYSPGTIAMKRRFNGLTVELFVTLRCRRRHTNEIQKNCRNCGYKW